jgi:ribosome recycling factor
VQQNKTAIREMDELAKDKIMSLHLDLRLVNDSSASVNDKMQSLRHQARKLAFDYL